MSDPLREAAQRLVTMHSTLGRITPGVLDDLRTALAERPVEHDERCSTYIAHALYCPELTSAERDEAHTWMADHYEDRDVPFRAALSAVSVPTPLGLLPRCQPRTSQPETNWCDGHERSLDECAAEAREVSVPMSPPVERRCVECGEPWPCRGVTAPTRPDRHIPHRLAPQPVPEEPTDE